jgi:hypothetical protein
VVGFDHDFLQRKKGDKWEKRAMSEDENEKINCKKQVCRTNEPS